MCTFFPTPYISYYALFIDACKNQCDSAPVITDRDGCKAACQHCIPQCNYDTACLQKCAKMYKNDSESIQSTSTKIQASESIQSISTKIQASVITTTVIFLMYNLLLK